MWPTVERVLGAVMLKRTVGPNPIGFVIRRSGAYDKVGVAGCQRVKHSVVGCADGAAQRFLGGLAGGEETADPDEFYPVHGHPAMIHSLPSSATSLSGM